MQEALVPRLLHSLTSVAVGLSVGYETWPLVGWHHPFVIGWSKYRLRFLTAPLHYEFMWPVGIHTVFQTPVTVPLHHPNGRQMSALRAVQGDCERVYLLHSCVGSVCMFNSLIPGRCGCNLNFHFISSIYIVSISCEIALGWMSVMSQDLTDDEPTLVQVMTWCPSGNKPFPESMLTKFYDAMWCH